MNLAMDVPTDQQKMATQFAQRVAQAEREIANRDRHWQGGKPKEELDDFLKEENSGFILSSN